MNSGVSIGLNKGLHIGGMYKNNMPAGGMPKVTYDFKNAIYIDGTSNEVNAPLNSSYLVGTGPISLGTWFFIPTSGNVARHLFGIHQDANNHFAVYTVAGGALRVQALVANAQTVLGTTVGTTAKAYRDKAWNLISWGRDKDGNCALYLNGNLVDTKTSSINITLPSGNVIWGGSPKTQAGAYQRQVEHYQDTSFIFNTNLPPSQHKKLYSSGRGSDPRKILGCLSYWPFDDNSASTTPIDVGPLKNHGSLVNYSSTQKKFLNHYKIK